jgi:hypothetical protein
MSDFGKELEGWERNIKESSVARKREEEEFFEKYKPVAEFDLLNADDNIPTHYGVWAEDHFPNDFLIMYKMPNGKYSLMYKQFISKELIKELNKLLEGESKCL